MSSPMKRVISTTLPIIALASLAWFALACGSDEAPTDEPDADATITAATATTILEATAEAVANEQPTDTPAPTATPEPPPTPTPVPTLPPTLPPTQAPAAPAAPAATDSDGGDSGSADVLAPLPMSDVGALLAGLSDGERACLTQNSDVPTDRMDQLMTMPEMSTPEERSAFLGCLEHDTEVRLILTGVLSATGPLSVESSACLRDSYADVDVAELLSGAASDLGNEAAAQQAMARGMVMFIVSLSCLNEDEFAVAGPAMGIAPGEYEGFQCVLEAAGGPEKLAVWLSPGAEFPAELFQATTNCGVQMGAGAPPG